jgi:hypothetical protein
MADEERWFEKLEPEETAFIRRFVLASGSLKEMAEQYGVSYPTIRARLDGLIAKMRTDVKAKPDTHLRRTVRALVEEGALDLPEARRLLEAGARDLKTANYPKGGEK